MKKLFIAVIFIFSILFATCNNPDSNTENTEEEIIYTPPPTGVYIAGITDDGQFCYWTDNNRIDIGFYRNWPESIMVSDGSVLVFGDNGLYWVDGERYEIMNFENRKVIINRGKVYKFEGPRNFWIDGVLIENTNYFNSGFDFYDFDVFNGKMYITGIRNVTKRPLYIFEYDRYFLINFITIDAEITSFIPKAITVSDDGTVYVFGQNARYNPDKAWYYSEGIFYEIEEFNNSFSGCRITVSDGKVYIFPDLNNVREAGFFCNYWIDGKKVSVSVTDGNIRYITVSGGKTYMAGLYLKAISEDEYTTAACYWIDGVRYNLDGQGASAIYVKE